MTTRKMTPAQERALAKLSLDEKSAYTLGLPISTLDALVARGFAARRGELGSMAFPRNAIYWRLTPAGAEARAALSQEKK